MITIVFLWVIHNIDNGGRKYDRNGVGIIRGGIKKTVFLATLVALHFTPVSESVSGQSFGLA